MLKKYGHGYVVLCPTLQEALELEERGIHVPVGDLDDPETYRRMRLDQAALMVTTRTDVINVNATFTARELSEDVPIVATGACPTSGVPNAEASAISRLSRLPMTRASESRMLTRRASAEPITSSCRRTIVAPASSSTSRDVSEALGASGMRNRTGVGVIGVWNHGQLEVVDRDTLIKPEMIFILAGTREQIDHYNAA